MKSIFKISFKNMFSKKGRSLMLILSIILSSGLVYSVVNLSLFTKDIFISGITKEYGDSNIIVYKEDYTLITESLIVDSEFDYIIESNSFIGYTEFDSRYVVNIQALSIQEFDDIYDFEYIEKLDREFDSNYILIGEENSIEFDLSTNDIVTLSFNGDEYDLAIYGVVKEGTTFLDISSNTLDIVVNKDFIKNTLGIESPNIYLINSDDEMIVKELQNNYSSLVVNDIFGEEDMITSMQAITVPLFLMASCVVIISSFVIYSTYKIIIIERLPLLGTLRSVGASKKYSNRVLLIESSIYGIIGGFIGIGFGMLFLSGMFNMFFKDTDFSSVDVSYFNLQFAFITILLSIVLSVFSSLIPIIRTSKYSIKSIMFGETKTSSKVSYKKAVIGIVLILLAFIIAETSNYENELMLSGIAMLMAIIGAVLSVSLLILLIAPVVKIILQPIFKNNVEISINNIKNDKTLINNIVLLAVGLGMIFMINNFSTTVSEAVVGVYDKAKFDLNIYGVNIDDNLINDILEVDGVDNIYSTKNTYNIKTTEGIELLFVSGIELNEYKNYAWGEYEGLITPELLDDFYNKNSIIITTFTADKYNLDIGDKIHLIVNDIEVELEIIAAISSILYNGNNNFMSTDQFSDIFEIEGYQNAYINTTGDIDEIKNKIKELYIYGVLPIDSLDEMEEVNQDNNAMLFTLLRGISFLAMLIGSVGIINNFMVSFLSRRKLIASLRSIGLSKRGTVKLFLIEALTAGVIGSFIGVMFGNLFFKFTVYVIAAINITPEVATYSVKEMIFIFISGIILSVTAAILPALHISKQNIVKEIKYE